MKKVFLGALITFSFALLVIACLRFFIFIPETPNIRDLKVTEINGKISTVLSIRDKEVIKKTTNNTNYLNSWKLSATIIGKNSFAMVIKGRDSKVLRLNDALEGYKVSKIEKGKILFSSKTDDIWLYIKTKKLKLNNTGIAKVMPQKGIFTIRQGYINRYLKKPERLLKSVNIMPESINGKFTGMKIKGLLEGSFLYQNGLRKGDLIQKINGKKLLSIADGITAYQNITTSSKFSLSVLRDNKIEEFKYEIVK